MRTTLALAVLALTVACSSQSEQHVLRGQHPLSPSKTLEPAPAPTPHQPQPDIQPRDLSWQVEDCERPCTIRVLVTVRDAVDDFHFEEPFAAHQDERDGGPTIERRKPWLRVLSGKTDYRTGDDGILVLGFDTRQCECGSTQLDLDRVFRDGRKETVFGWMYRCGPDCGPGRPECQPGTLNKVKAAIRVEDVQPKPKQAPDVVQTRVYVDLTYTYVDAWHASLYWRNPQSDNVSYRAGRIKATWPLVAGCFAVPRTESHVWEGGDVLHRQDEHALFSVLGAE